MPLWHFSPDIKFHDNVSKVSSIFSLIDVSRYKDMLKCCRPLAGDTGQNFLQSYGIILWSLEAEFADTGAYFSSRHLLLQETVMMCIKTVKLKLLGCNGFKNSWRLRFFSRFYPRHIDNDFFLKMTSATLAREVSLSWDRFVFADLHSLDKQYI